MKKKVTLSVLFVILLLMATVAWFRFRVQTKGLLFALFPIFSYEAVDQPVLFNHLKHRDVAKLQCTFCHRYVEKARAATIPNIEICQACHSTDAISKAPQALKVVQYVKARKPIPWNRMYQLPPFVVFPHWPHIEAKIDCSVCHGLTGVSERPVRMLDRVYMEWCIHCHNQRGVSVECYTCHSS